MEDGERLILQRFHLELVETLDSEYLIDYLFGKECLTELDIEELDSKQTRHERAKGLLRIAKRKCSIWTFVDCLKYKNTYTFLAEKIERMLEESGISRNGSSSVVDWKRTEDKEITLFPAKPNRISPHGATGKKKVLLIKLANYLKRLCFEGKLEEHESYINKLQRQSKHDADVSFLVLDARVRNMRVHCDASLKGSDIFQQIQAIIPFTSNPTASSMSYLARKGSLLAMVADHEEGLKQTEFAKMHAEHILPSRETALVFYIEINLLMQLFEKVVSKDVKEQIINRISIAISHFSYETDDLKIDNTRMLYLKMAACYLGIGIFANRIKNYNVTKEDVKLANSCLDLVYNNWDGIDSRRKMFYYYLRAMAYNYSGNIDKAHVNSEIARDWARTGNFKKELSNIEVFSERLNDDIKQKLENDGVEILNELSTLKKIQNLPKDISKITINVCQNAIANES